MTDETLVERLRNAATDRGGVTPYARKLAEQAADAIERLQVAKDTSDRLALKMSAELGPIQQALLKAEGEVERLQSRERDLVADCVVPNGEHHDQSA